MGSMEHTDTPTHTEHTTHACAHAPGVHITCSQKLLNTNIQ